MIIKVWVKAKKGEVNGLATPDVTRKIQRGWIFKAEGQDDFELCDRQDLSIDYTDSMLVEETVFGKAA